MEHFLHKSYNFFIKGYKSALFVVVFCLMGVMGKGQVVLTNASPSVTINFSNSTPTSAGSNPSTAFTGAGFEPNPTTGGRLNSNAWSISGLSDGNLAFGGTYTTGDHARGAFATSQTTGGIYAYTGAPHSASNPCLMIQPGGSDFAPGTLTLKLTNNGTSPITSISVSYNLFVRNDQARSNSFNFSYSVDDVSYTSVSALDYTSVAASDGLGWVLIGTAPSRTTNISSLNIAPGSFIYIRWSSNDFGGSGSRDEFGLDDIELTASYTSLPTNIPSDPGVNWLGSNQLPKPGPGYIQPTNCNGSSPFVMKYRRIATTLNQPTDGRGQWVTTINSQATGGDVLNSNLGGGTGSGFLFTSGGSCGSTSASQWDNKWVFSGVGQGTINGVNGNVHNGSTDMGLNMSTAGYYTFVMRDNGYNSSNFYVGYTSAAPVSIVHNAVTQVTLNGDYSTTIQATLSGTASAQESFYVRYRVVSNDFSTGTFITAAASVSGTTATMTIPPQAVGATVYYYIFSSTVAYATLNGYLDGEKSLATLSVADNSNTNYSFIIPASITYTWVGTGTGSWSTSSNWSPAGIPVNGDAVVFDNTTNVIVTGVPSINLKSVTMTGAGSVTWQAFANRTVNVGFTGASNPVFSLVAGKQLNFTGTTNDIVLNIKSGFNASIFGTIVFGGSASVAHRLTGETANAITFETGSRFEAANNFSGNAFGSSGLSNTVVFKTGSKYDYFDGANPFGLNNPDSKVVFEKGSLYIHNSTSFPSFSGRIYADVQIMSGAGTSLNNLTGTSSFSIDNLTLETGVTLGLNVSGSHTIKGNITVASGAYLNFTPTSAGTINLSGTSAQDISGAGILTIGANSTINITNNTAVYLKKDIVDNGNIIVATGGRFEMVNENFVSGTGVFTLQSNSTLGIGSSSGITSSGATGNIRTTTRNFISQAHYLYNGTVDQVTGNGLPLTINILSISNTGNTVTLTTTNTTTTTLNLNQGFFAAGTGQTLKIANPGAIYGTGGHNPGNATAGFIEFLGDGATYGNAPSNPRLYSVLVGNGGVNFNGTPAKPALIMNSLQINSGGFVNANPPSYDNNSTLIYNTNFNRNTEWASGSSGVGVPFHVTVNNGYTLNLDANPAVTAASRTCLGNLTVNGSLTMGAWRNDLTVKGNVVINGTLTMSSDNTGSDYSDIYLEGNWIRNTGGVFDASGNRDRAVFFQGTGNSTITATGSGELFPYLFITKSASDKKVICSSAVTVTKILHLTTGLLETGAATTSNILIMTSGSSYTGGNSTNSFVAGAMRKIGNTDFTFPVGKRVNDLTNHFRTIGISSLSGNLSFTAEFRRENATTLGPVTASGPPPLTRVSACEYWTLDRAEASGTSNVTLSWSAESPCNTASYISDLATLVIAHGTGKPLVPNSGVWDSYGGLGNATGTTTAGSITWNTVGVYSPFSLGSVSVKENILPFNLSSFTARARKSDIQIDWNVMNNNDQDEYILEHSKDGIQFTTLKVVKAKVILNQAAYTELDQKPYNGWNYYRLRAKDKLDREKLSQVVKVWFGFADVIRISPNPASEKININLAEPSSINQIQLVNSTGQILKQVSNIQFSNEINISELAAGVYYLRLTGKSGLTIKSFVKN